MTSGSARVSDRTGPVGVVGLSHLGSVTAACLADAGNQVIGVDPRSDVVGGLRQGRPPIYEPGLAELLARNVERLGFSSDPRALLGARLAWVTFDTPVDDEDQADVDWVIDRSVEMLASLPVGSLVIVSSQLPVGSVERLRVRCSSRRDGARAARPLRFACIPENLRLGEALECFRNPDRIVVGVRCEEDRRELAELLAPFSTEPRWMRIESAEMTKHALNGFLATSVAFINEVAAICEGVGADAAEVSDGLRSERRIGPHAYLKPGDAFAGGTLARDVGYLREQAERAGLSAHVLAGVAGGNAAHRRWSRRKVLGLLGDGPRALRGRTVAVWGLTYKPGTSTLRRSSALELCRWLANVGAVVRAHDPAVRALPPDFVGRLELCADPLAAATGAELLVICTPWPEYLQVPVDDLLAVLAAPLLVDPGGLLAERLQAHPDVRYERVGSGGRELRRQ